MDGEQLKRHFERIGATLEIELLRPPSRGGGRGTTDFTLDVREKDKRETFVLAVRRELAGDYEFAPLEIQPGERHLVLMAKTNLRRVAEPKQKFLCGHDERHWFVATLPRQVTTVREAFEALIPADARAALVRRGVGRAHRYRRHNAGYLRQGEWFFVPEPGFHLEHTDVIHTHEPIRRSNGKAHYVENVVRRGGMKVYVCRDYPNGATEEGYKYLVQQDPNAAKKGWQIMVRDATVYARGAVRHPDHKTLLLKGWYRVLMSTEQRAEALVFLD